MCGICGFTGHRNDQKAVIERMMKSIEHRGPDSEGSFCGGGDYPWVRRLSIIDLEDGQQPMESADGNLQIVFNEGVVLAVVATGCNFSFTHWELFDISLGAATFVFCNHGCGYLQYYTECGVNDPGNLCKRSCMFPCKFPAGFGISYSSICYYSCHDVCAFCDCLTDHYHKGWCTWRDQYSGSSGKAV